MFEEIKKEGEEFLKKNKDIAGVTVLQSGLQYKILTEGTGASPKSTDSVTVHYKGTFINGNEFDSSYKRNSPATFKLNKVIKGWTEGVQLMKEGGKIALYIPYNLAYGENGAGSSIPPYSAMIFEVELLSVN